MNIFRKNSLDKTGQIDVGNETELYRGLCIAASVLSVIFAFILKYTNHSFQLIPSIITAIIFLSVFIFSYTSTFTKKNLAVFVEVLCYLASFKSIYSAYINDFSADYSSLLIMVILLCSLSFRRYISLIIFNFTNVTVIAVIGYFFTISPHVNMNFYLMDIITINIISMFIMSYRSEINESLSKISNIMNIFFNDSNDSKFIVDAETYKIIDCNQRAIKMFEFDSKKDILKTGDIRFLQKYIQKPEIEISTIRENDILKEELEYITKKGKEFWALLSVKKLKIGGKNLLLFRISNIDKSKKAAEELRKAQMFNQHITDETPNIIYIYDLIKKQLVYTNKNVAENLGYSEKDLENNNFFRDVIFSEDYKEGTGNLKRYYFVKDGEVIESEFRIKDNYENWHWLSVREKVFSRTEDGNPMEIIGTAQDVTERKMAEQNHQRLAAFPKENPNPILECDFEGNITYINPSAEIVMEKLKIELSLFLPKNHYEIVKNVLYSRGGQYNTDIEVNDRVFNWTYNKINKVEKIHLYGYDITEQKRIEDRLVHDALYDGLTGLPNRVLFLDRLTNAVNRHKRNENYLFAVLFLDLDRFKIINDSLGHLFGDKLLIHISNRLKASLRPGDTVARLGGDEFTILLEDIKDINDPANVAERIKKELSVPFKINEHEIFTTISIGIALSSTGYINPEDLLRNADMAMYKAKSMGKSRYELFNKYMHDEAVESLKLETDLWKALEKQEFRVYYQPVIELATKKFVGFEALVRWKHPERGLLNPGDFISIAEETGFILHIDNWMIREACSEIAFWQSRLKLPFKLTLSVNISGRNFSQANFIEKISEILEDTGFEPNCLKLEISERVMMENTKTVSSVIQQLRDLNVQLQIDDFGTGYSSLSYLHSLPINALKVDSSFVSRLGSDNENKEVVKTIISLAHNLGIEVIAEGIETSLQFETLKKLKCKYGQGYFFFEPLHPAKAKELLVTEQLKYIKIK